jgi:hypothetical protein
VLLSSVLANQLAATAVDEGEPPTDSSLLMAFSALVSHCSKATSGAEAFVTESYTPEYDISMVVHVKGDVLRARLPPQTEGLRQISGVLGPLP